MLTGITAGHGAFSVKAVNVPVNICGMDVCPGDVIPVSYTHLDVYKRQAWKTPIQTA